MTIRGRIIGELHRRIAAALPDARLAVAADVAVKPKPGEVVLAVLPGEDTPWDDTSYPPGIYREWEVVVQVGRARAADETKDQLAAWQALEDVLADVVAAVEAQVEPTDDLAGMVKALDRMSVEPSEQPVGGVALGLDVTWRVRYAAT